MRSRYEGRARCRVVQFTDRGKRCPLCIRFLRRSNRTFTRAMCHRVFIMEFNRHALTIEYFTELHTSSLGTRRSCNSAYLLQKLSRFRRRVEFINTMPCMFKSCIEKSSSRSPCRMTDRHETAHACCRSVADTGIMWRPRRSGGRGAAARSLCDPH